MNRTWSKEQRAKMVELLKSLHEQNLTVVELDAFERLTLIDDETMEQEPTFADWLEGIIEETQTDCFDDLDEFICILSSNKEVSKY